MSSLSDDLGAIVRRNEEQRRQNEATEKMNAEMEDENVARSYRLEEEIQAALDDLEDDDQRPIRVQAPNPRPADTRGWAGWDVECLDANAEVHRVLQIQMIHPDHVLTWAWLDHPQEKMRWHKEDSAQFEVDPDLKRLLSELIDDDNWTSDGRHR